MKQATDMLTAIGANKAVIYGVLGRVWSSLAGFVTILVMAAVFSEELQGFYYTFGSLLAMQVFFELGLTGVIATFVSHEFSKLSWSDNGSVRGDLVAMQRFNDILCKSTKWFAVAALLLPLILIPAGLFFFAKGDSEAINISWRLPWILAVIGTALNLLAVPFFAVIIGGGDVVAANQRGLIGAVLGALLSWTVMWFGGGLYAVFAVTLGNVLVSLTYLLNTKSSLVKTAVTGWFNNRIEESNFAGISWKNEIWPLQWKIAITWVSGYFIFQLFNPILFHFHGAAIAGKMGMTLSISTAILALSTVWTNAKAPELGKLIAEKDWAGLDQVFFKVFYQSIGVAIVCAFFGWLTILFLQANYPLGQRFLPSNESAILLITTVILIISNGLAVYLRAHKEEPLTKVTVITACLQLCSALILGKLYSSEGMLIGYFLIMVFFSMPAIYLIWAKLRKEWHST